MTDHATRPEPPLIDPEGGLLPVWGFLVFHRAIRRDVLRFRTTTLALGAGDESVDLDGLRDHWTLHRRLLAFHHEAEDERLVPLLRDARPPLRPVLDQVDIEHQRLDELVEALTTALLELPRRAEFAAELAGSFADLVLPHLALEEDHLVPAVVEMVRAGELAVPGPPPDDGPADLDYGGQDPERVLPWYLDGLASAEHDLVLAQLPAHRRRDHARWAPAHAERLARWVRPAA